MTNSTAPIFMETIDKLGAGHLFGLAAESEPLPAGSLPTGSSYTATSYTATSSIGPTSAGPTSAGSASTGAPSTGSLSAGPLSAVPLSAVPLSAGPLPAVPPPGGSLPGGSPSAAPGYAESRAETTERLRLVAARSGEPADLRDYLTALATAVPAMSPDNCRLVAGLLGVGVAPAFRESGPVRQP